VSGAMRRNISIALYLNRRINLRSVEVRLAESTTLPVSLERVMPDQSFYHNCKSVFEVSLALVAFVVSLPVLALACLVVRLDSPGSPIFTQTRIGRGGKQFKLYKIRTMYLNTEKDSCVTAAGDPRITRVGRWLRSSKIDELPQLVNIIIGNMSVVGPRPLSAEECKLLARDGFTPNHPGFIPTVSPGLIGIEQLNRDLGLSYEGRFALNALYERRMSLQLDLRILIRSIVQCRILVYCVTLACFAEIVFFAAYSQGSAFNEISRVLHTFPLVAKLFS
jgi:lipopolysaccharide/colanic/teichoic acid biosynthesis glycosyltransferase